MVKMKPKVIFLIVLSIFMSYRLAWADLTEVSGTITIEGYTENRDIVIFVVPDGDMNRAVCPAEWAGGTFRVQGENGCYTYRMRGLSPGQHTLRMAWWPDGLCDAQICESYLGNNWQPSERIINLPANGRLQNIDFVLRRGGSRERTDFYVELAELRAHGGAFTVRNRAGGGNINQPLTYEYTHTLDGRQIEHDRSTDNRTPFRAGAVIFSYPFGSEATGHHIYTLRLDPDNRLFDSNRNNNTARYEVLVLPPPADLCAVSIEFIPNGAQRGVDEVRAGGLGAGGTLKFVIQNDSNNAITNTTAKIEVAGREIVRRQFDLQPHRQFILDYPNYSFDTAGNFIIKGSVEYVSDTNSNNNSVEKTIRVLEPLPMPAPIQIQEPKKQPKVIQPKEIKPQLPKKPVPQK